MKIFSIFKAITKFNGSVLYFAFLVNQANGEQLRAMVDLILNSARNGNGRDLMNLTTLDNETPLARALCHPAVTMNIVQRLLDENDRMDENQVLVAFDIMARHHNQRQESLDYLKPLLSWLTIPNYREIFNQLAHICCRYDDVSLLKWLHQIMKEVGLNMKNIPFSNAER